MNIKCPLYLNYVLALPWEIRSAWLSRRRNNKVYIWIINWIATNTTGSYCIRKSHTCHIACAQHVRLQHERKRVDTDATRPLHVQRLRIYVTQSGPFAVDASFKFVYVRDLGKIDSLAKHTPNDVVNRVQQIFKIFLSRNNILSWRMRYPVWIHCCKRPNTTSPFHNTTVLRWGGQNCSQSRQVSSFFMMLLAKLLKSTTFLRSYSKK